MKKKSYLLLGMAAILPTLTSCSSEDAVTGGADASGVTRVSLAATINKDAASRVEITENDATNLNQGLIENWSTSDAIYVKNASALTGDPWTLTKSTADAGQSTATFTGDLDAADGVTLLGYYPANLSIASGESKALVNYSMQGGTLPKVQKMATMGASAAYTATGTTAFSFNNTSTILRIRFNNTGAASKKITKITVAPNNFSTANNTLYNKEYMTPTVAGATWAAATKGNLVAIPSAANSSTDGDVASDGTKTFYMNMIPQTVSSGFTVTAQCKDNTTYTYTSNSSSTFSIGKVQTVNVNNTATGWVSGSAKNSSTTTLWDGKYYGWDGTIDATGTNNTGYNSSMTNTAPETDVINVAQACCENCPTYKQIRMYLGAGVYLDSYTTWTGAPTTHYGIWLKKACYIDGFAEGTATTKNTANYTATITSSSDANYASVCTSGEYFFLPAAGYYNSGSLGNAGTGGYYWSSTPYSSTTYAWNLNFNSSNAYVDNNNRSNGFCLWAVQ